MKLSLLLAVTAGAALAAPAAAGARTSVPAGGLFTGPVLAGEDVVWSVQRPDRGVDLRVAPGAAGAPRTFASFPAQRNQQRSASLAAAGSRVFVTLRTQTAYEDRYEEDLGSESLAGSVAGPFERLAGCQYGTFTPPAGDADRVVYVGCDPRAITVRRFADGAETRLGSGSAPQLAGRFAAWLSDAAEIVVHDLEAGTEAMRLPRAALGGGVDSFDVREDGTVVFAVHAAENGADRVAWAAPAEPRAHLVDLPKRRGYRVRFAGSSVVYSGAGGKVGRATRQIELGRIALRGRYERRRVLYARNGSTGVAFDTDGTRVAFALRRCGRMRVVTQRLDEPRLRPARC